MTKLIFATIVSSLLLPASAMASTAPRESSEADEKPKVTCKRLAETGSLVKKRRVCLTDRQWDEVHANSSDRAREMQTLISTERGN